MLSFTLVLRGCWTGASPEKLSAIRREVAMSSDVATSGLNFSAVYGLT